jgi:hypothetical protein
MSDRAHERRDVSNDLNGEVSRRTFLQLAGVTGVVVGAMLPHMGGGAAEAAVTGSSLQGMADVAGFEVSPDRLQQLSGAAQGILSAIAELRRLDIPEVEPVTVYHVPKA